MAKEKKKSDVALPEGDEATPPKKSGKKRIIIILLIFLLMSSGIGAGAYWWFFMRNPVSPPVEGQPHEEQVQDKEEGGKTADAKQGEPAKTGGQISKPAGLPRSSGVVLPLPYVTVNLYDSGAVRYLKLGMEVEANKDISQALKANEARIRDAVIMLLAGKSLAEVSSPDGKVMLKAEVANRLNQILGEQRIVRVYFTDFVVQ
ncbi:MAG: flagellar basal body-associated FliL family protein [Desulfovibrio sp.]|nr:flagellar basal body-associated FliL family protein [Desulfovibrio sp.]